MSEGGTTMRLSEAIRLGSMLKPQTHGYLADVVGVTAYGDVLGLRTVITATCAMGAAGDALGLLGINGEWKSDTCGPPEWKWMKQDGVLCPQCGECNTAEETIMRLNDDHGWTREQIADWVATIEPECADSAARSDEPATVVAGSASSGEPVLTLRA